MTAIAFRHEPRSRVSRSVPGARPKVSIILAADAARQCLDELLRLFSSEGRPDSRAAGVEVLVVRPGARRIGEERDGRHPIVRYVGAPADATRCELREQGIRHAIGDVVVLVDDDRQLDLRFLEDLIGGTINSSVDEREIKA